LGNNVEATFDFVERTKFQRKNLFDIVAVFGNKVERCFDIVAGVDGALLRVTEFPVDQSTDAAMATMHHVTATSVAISN